MELGKEWRGPQRKPLGPRGGGKDLLASCLSAPSPHGMETESSLKWLFAFLFGYYNRNDRGKSKKGVSFHRFPKEKALREQWVKAVRRLKWEPGVNAFLCSEHFRVELLNRTFASGRTELKENSVPTIFSNYPKYLQPSIKKNHGYCFFLDSLTKYKNTTTNIHWSMGMNHEENMNTWLHFP